MEPATRNYVTRVHRRREGDPLLAFDAEACTEARATLAEGGRAIVVAADAIQAGTRPGNGQVWLFQGYGKGSKLDLVVREVTALGAGHVQPVVCERSVARPEAPSRAQKRAERLRSVALEAARQCERSDIPEILPPTAFPKALERAATLEHLVLSPHGVGEPLLEALPQGIGMRGIALWVGPEGGFAPQELGALQAAGARLISLGPWVLRTETAASAAVALAMAALATRS